MPKKYTPNSLLTTVLNSQAALIIFAAVAVICSGTGIGLVALNNSTKQDEVVTTTTSFKSAKFQNIDQILNLELATTPKQREQGLMNRTQMASDTGMLFIFPEEQPLTFWMRNTFIPLDIVFMDNELRVINIHKNTKTNQISELYASTRPARYVLEVNAGWTDQHQLQAGDQLVLI
jgi:hypothetical protein